MKDKPLTRCKKCRGKLEKMLPRNINLIFKGSGFYITDYRKSKAGKKPAAESGDAGGKSDTKSTKAESKAAES
jgi:predicted nucleic acid-binding Zn ribbon protein